MSLDVDLRMSQPDALLSAYPLAIGEIGVTTLRYPIGDVRRYGAVFDGAHDDGPAINNAIQSMNALGGGEVNLAAGVGMSSVAILMRDFVLLRGPGRLFSTIRATATATMVDLIDCTDVNAIGLAGFTADANATARIAAGGITTGAAQAIGWHGVRYSTADEVRVMRSIGSSAGPYAGGGGIGFGVGGSGTRTSRENELGTIYHEDCGTDARRSDGFYFGSDDSSCRAVYGLRATDTCAVLEHSSNSVIDLVVSRDCTSVCALTTVNDDNENIHFGTVIANNWSTTVSGAVQIGSLGSGILTNVGIQKLVLTGIGYGPGISFKKTGIGHVDGVTLGEVTIDATMDLQAVVGTVKNLRVGRMTLKGSPDVSFQLTAGSSGIVEDLDLEPAAGAPFGAIITDSSDVHLPRIRIRAAAMMNYGVYYFGTGARNTIGKTGNYMPGPFLYSAIGNDPGNVPVIG